MILILSDSKDLSTTCVIEWLEFLNKKWIRINTHDDIKIKHVAENILFIIKDNAIKISEIEAVWYRRGYFILKNEYATKIYNQIDNLQNEELKMLIQYVYHKLFKIKHINKIMNADVNKLIVNDIARDLKILTPYDLVFSDLKMLKETIEKNTKDEYITKVVSGNCMQTFEDFIIYNYTKKLNLEKINDPTFFPSLIQNKIEKKYELRIFYLHSVFYSMAIFSQKDNQTNVDFRNYNDDKPNRTVPYKLPKKIEEKLDLLMKKLDLNSGSIDMIVTPSNEYIFLEVNPVGQFSMVSYPCNYNLEKRIAEYL